MKQTLIAKVEDKPGVLNRVASLFRRRDWYNNCNYCPAGLWIGIGWLGILLQGDLFGRQK